jgi:hypothetical protein
LYNDALRRLQSLRRAIANDLVNHGDERIQAFVRVLLELGHAVHALSGLVLELGEPIDAIGEHDLRDEQALVLFFEFEMAVDKNFNQTLQAIQPAGVVSVARHMLSLSCVAGVARALSDDLIDDGDQRVHAFRAFSVKFRQPVQALVEPSHAIGEHNLGDEQALVLFFEFEMAVDKNFNQTLQAIQPAGIVSIVGHASFILARLCVVADSSARR